MNPTDAQSDNKAIAFDHRVCELGEGAFWHPERGQFFWFDILNRRLYARGLEGVPPGPQSGSGHEWRLPRIASAAGMLDDGRLLLATETGLAILDLETGDLQDHLEVEAERPETRSNDGRADRQGGFWFGTMGKRAEAGAGAIYRYYRGQVTKLVPEITIPNAICFAPDGSRAFYADTASGTVWTQALDADGWPKGDREVFLDLAPQGLEPDGAVIDRDGGIWIAKWGAGAVMRYDMNGTRTGIFPVRGAHSTCPAFGGADLGSLLVTTALEGIEKPDQHQGLPYLIYPGHYGLAEPMVVL